VFQFVFFPKRLGGRELGFLAMGGAAILLVDQSSPQPDLFTAQEAKHSVFSGLMLPARFYQLALALQQS
jgi:hypothetical protein